MKIRILKCIDGARKADGLTVIIDVFRAFSLACYVMNNGAKRIIPVEDIELAYELKKRFPDYILLGERKGMKPDGFDYGNSPCEIEDVDFKGKTVIHTTSAGTKGLVNAKGADILLTGSFVNSKAIADYIIKKDVEKVSLVAMGTSGRIESDEDTLCAEYIKSLIRGRGMDFREISNHLKDYRSGLLFLEEKESWAKKEDFYLCIDNDKFDFVIKSRFDEELHMIVLEKESIVPEFIQ